MRHFTFIVFAALMLFNCGSGTQQDTGTKIIEDEILTFDLSFGDNDLPADFLLAKPRNIAVDRENRVYVSDEQRIKIFNPDGTPDKIIGEPGQGPGEFDGFVQVFIGPNNLMSIKDVKGISFYDRNLDFINLKRYDLDSTPGLNSVAESTDVRLYNISMVTSITDDEKIGEFWLRERTKEKKDHIILVHETNDKFNPIASFNNRTNQKAGGLNVAFSHRGRLVFQAYDNELIYWYPDYRIPEQEEKCHYTINIYSLESSNSRSIKHKYNPAFLPDSLLSKYDDLLNSSFTEDFRGETKVLVDKYKNEKYYGPVKSLYVDKDLIFVVTNLRVQDKGFFTDIFQLKSGEYLHSVYFPSVPDVIKNGYAYKLLTGRNVLPTVVKYKISGAAYSS
ncbi:MAG: hypothetical protein GY863_13525 [bacterium]|nr:hypothetical protein [bacterium]